MRAVGQLPWRVMPLAVDFVGQKETSCVNDDVED